MMFCCYCGMCREEISEYKELDPTNRLLILKALCEIRAEVICLAFLIQHFSQMSEVPNLVFNWMMF